MAVGWRDIAFVPDGSLSAEIAEAWEWLLGSGDWTPVLCSKLGDYFFERPDGQISWLSCSAGLVEEVAPNRMEFDELCRAGEDEVADWFGPGLIETLHEADKVAGDGQCYFFITLPIFAECRYEPDNLAVVPTNEVFVGLADIHKQMLDLPDGAKVQIKVVD